MDLVDFQRNFPPGEVVPEPLRLLLEFQNQARVWYSDHFELDTWEYGQSAWFDGDRATAMQFVVFGHGPDGSLYALWLYPGRTVADAPVVFLGSEGTGSSLLAGDLREFLSLLAIGADELGFAARFGDVVQSTSPAARLTEFRAWLRDSFGITAPDQPDTLVFEARQRHPNFGKWLADWKKSHFGS